MSETVEKRAVEMRFDNSQFEKNISQSQNSLNSFNKSLSSLNGVKTGIGAFAAQVKGITFDPINNGIQIGIGKLAALTAALTGVSNLATDIYNKTTSLIKSMTFDNVTAGFQKYESKTASVQTIMNAVRKEGETDEAVMARVNSQLEKLNWFTDETSYNFTDMVSNIGKFTSQGIDLDKSVTAMQGIATWAAKSGQGVNEASRAMYNLSQAMGTGAVKLIDWKSIENANMATKEFKEQAIEAALATGKLKKEGEKIFTNTGGKKEEVNIQTFNSTLDTGWFSSDTLLQVLQTYGSYADIVHEVQKDGETAAETMARLKEEGKEAGNELAASAFKAAQEAKTFTEAIDATKDAVSTAFLNIFETLFGNYLEAKELWTSLANTLYDAFAAPVVELSDLLKKWKETGGKFQVFTTIKKILTSISDLFGKIKETWQSIFKPLNVQMLQSMTNKFAAFGNSIKRLTDKILKNEKVWENLLTFFKGLKDILDVVKGAFKEVFGRAFSAVSKNINAISEAISGFLAKIGEILSNIAEFIRKSDMVNNILNTAISIFKAAANAVKIVASNIKDLLFNNPKDNTIDQLAKSAKNAVEPLEILETIIKTIIDFVTSAIISISPVISQIWIFAKGLLSNLGSVFKSLVPILKNTINYISQLIGYISKVLKDLLTGIDFTSPFTVLRDIIAKIIVTIRNFISSVFKAADSMSNVPHSSIFEWMAKGISNFSSIIVKNKDNILWVKKNLFNDKDLATVLSEIGKSIADIIMTLLEGAAAIALLINIFKVAKEVIFGKEGFISKILSMPKKFVGFLDDLLNPIEAFKDFLQGLLKKVDMFAVSNMLSALGGAFLKLAIGMLLLTLVPEDKIVSTMLMTAYGIAILTGAVIALMQVLKNGKKGSSGGLSGFFEFTEIAATIVALGTAILIIAGAMTMISNIKDVGRAIGSLTIIMVMMAGLVASMFALSNYMKSTKGLIKVAFAIIIIANAVKTMSKSLVTLSTADPDSVLMAMTTIMVVMGVLMILIAEVTALNSKMSALVGLGLLMDLASKMFIKIAIAMKIISTIKDTDLMTAAMMNLLSITLTLGVLVTGMVYLSNQITSGTQIGGLAIMSLMLTTLVGAVLSIAVAIRLLLAGGIDSEDILKASASLALFIGATITIMVTASKYAKQNVGSMFALSSAFVILSMGLLALVPVIKEISRLNIAQIGAILVTITGFLGAFVLMSKIVATDVVKMIASMAGLSISLALLAVSLTLLLPVLVGLSDIDADQVGTILKILGGLFGIFIVAGGIIGNIKGVGKGMFIFAAALAALGVAAAIAASYMGSMADAIESIANSIKTISEVGPKAAENIKITMAAFASGLIDIFKAIGDGFIEMIKRFISNKSVITSYVGLIISVVFDALLASLPTVMEFLGEFLGRVLDILFTLGPRVNEFITVMVSTAVDGIYEILDSNIERVNDLITKAVETALEDILGLLIDITPKLVETVKQGTLDITQGVADMTIEITEIVLEALDKLLDVLMENSPPVIAKSTAYGIQITVAILAGMIQGILKSTPMLVDTAAKSFVEFVDEICEVLENNSDAVYDAMKKLIETACQTLGEWLGRMWCDGGLLFMIGRNIVKGISRGITSSKSKAEIKQAAIMTADTYKRAIISKEALDEHSPSKAMYAIGQFATDGFVNGVKSNFGDVRKAGYEIGDSIKDTLGKTLSSMGSKLSEFGPTLLNSVFGSSNFSFDISSIFGGMTNLNPTITPNLDLSVMQKQAGSIDSLFANKQITAISDTMDWNKAQSTLLENQNIMDSVKSKEQMNEFMNMFSNFIDIEKYNANKPTNVNVTLDGDASKMLKVLKIEDAKQFKATGLRSLKSK